MSGKRLPADLVLALREASVNLRAPSITSKSKRSKFKKQGSDSLRSASRSSGMPSIQEMDKEEPKFEFDRVPSSFGALNIPSEIAAEERSTMDVSTLMDSQHTDGVSIKPSKIRAKPRDSTRNSTTTEPLNASQVDRMESSVSVSRHSIGMEMLFNFSPRTQTTSKTGIHANMLSQSGLSAQSQSHLSPNFNASTATMLISNTKDLLNASHKVLRPPIESIDDIDEMTEGDYVSPLRVSSFVSQSGSLISTGSSTSTEITANYSTTVTPADEVSRASTLPSRRLPIGVNPTPPLEGVESDDLSAIFREAAKRFHS